MAYNRPWFCDAAGRWLRCVSHLALLCVVLESGSGLEEVARCCLFEGKPSAAAGLRAVASNAAGLQQPVWHCVLVVCC